MKMQGRADLARSAVFWNTGFNVFRDVLQFAVMLVLIRLLTPEAYGKFALVTSVVGFIAVFSYNEFLAYIVQAPDDSQVHAQDHFTAGAAMAIGLFVIANSAALLLRGFSEFRQVTPLLHLMSLTFLSAFPCDFRIKLLERAQDWKRLRLLHASGLLASAVLAIWMGWMGAGVYALLVPSLLVTIPFTLDLFLGLRWVPTWKWSWVRYQDAWRFGVTRIGSSATTRGRQMLEASMLAATLGMSGLGVFNRATGLAQMFCQKFAFQLLYATYPTLTRMDAGVDDVARINGLILRAVAWVVIPVGAIFAALSSSVVLTMYGEPWRQVIDVLPSAMFLGACVALSETTNTLLLSRQRPRLCLITDIAVLCGTVLLLVWALPAGPRAYLTGLTLLHALAFISSVFWLSRLRALQLSAVGIAILPPVFASLVGYGVCELWWRTTGFDVERFWTATIYGALFAAVYAVLLRVAVPSSLSEMTRQLRRGRHPMVPSVSAGQG